MIGIDTNVLVRYFLADDEIQARKARSFFAALTADEPGFVSVVALVELVCVLERAANATDPEIVAALRFLLTCDALVVESEAEAFVAMTDLDEGRARFADALIAALGQARGCSHTVTFNRKAARLPDFRLL